MHIHEEVLKVANSAASTRRDWTFTLEEVVKALPHLNVSSVRTHVVSRCCISAPKNHLHKWDYFRRVGRGRYQVEPEYRKKAAKSAAKPVSRTAETVLRDTIHVLVTRDGDTYIAECLELPVVTQGKSLDDLVENVREALALHLEDEDPADVGLQKEPRLQLTYELQQAI